MTKKYRNQVKEGNLPEGLKKSLIEYDFEFETKGGTQLKTLNTLVPDMMITKPFGNPKAKTPLQRKDMMIGGYTKNYLQEEAIKWIKELTERINNLFIREHYSSDIAYAAAEGIINLKKIEDDQLKLTKVEMFGQIEWIKYFFSITEDDLK